MGPVRNQFQLWLGTLISTAGGGALMTGGQSTGPWIEHQGALLALSLPLFICGLVLQLQTLRERGRRFAFAFLSIWFGLIVLAGWGLQQAAWQTDRHLSQLFKTTSPDISPALGAFHNWTFFASIALILGGILYHPAVFRPEPRSERIKRLLPVGAFIAALGAMGIHGALEFSVMLKAAPDMAAIFGALPIVCSVIGIPSLLCGIYLQARRSKGFGPSAALGALLVWVAVFQILLAGANLTILAPRHSHATFSQPLHSLEVWVFSISCFPFVTGIILMRRDRVVSIPI